MKIVSININSFGKLKNFQMDFANNVTVIQQTNGYGKSTVAAFVRAMLYGLSSTRAKTEEARMGDISRYAPWNSTEKFGGSMVVEHEGKAYRVERYFGKTPKDQTLSVVNVATGKALNVENVGEYFLGLTAESYDRSAYYPQDVIRFSSTENFDAKLANFVEDTGEDFDSIYEKLRKYKLRFRYENNRRGGEIYQLQEQANDLERQLENCKLIQRQRQTWEQSLTDTKVALAEVERKKSDLSHRLESLQQQYGQCKPNEADVARAKKIDEIDLQINSVPKSIEEDRNQVAKLEDQIDSLEKQRAKLSPRAKFSIILSVALVALVATLLAFSQFVFSAVAVVVAVAVFVIFNGKFQAKPTAQQVDDLKSALLKIVAKHVAISNKDYFEAKAEFWDYYNEHQKLLLVREAMGERPQLLQANQSQLQAQIDQTKQQLAFFESEKSRLLNQQSVLTERLSQPTPSLVDIAEKLSLTSQLVKEAQHKYDVASKTMDILKSAKESLSGAYLPKLCEATQRFLNFVTNGNYQVTTDRTFAISLTENGVTKPLASFSRGIKEIAILCFRVALSQLLYDGAIPFLIIDDAFVNFDEQNFARATALLKNLSQQTQVIYFTCHNRLADLRP